MKSSRVKHFFALLVFFLFAPLANAQTLVLRRIFIERYKNRATIDGMFIVDHAHARPNPPAKDGDLHASGRSDEVGLPWMPFTGTRETGSQQLSLEPGVLV
jgi:hypothetical protein